MKVLQEQLVDVLGPEGVTTDPERLRYYSSDIYYVGQNCDYVLHPKSVKQLVDLVEIANATGAALVPRGGGASYTGGFVLDQAGTLLVDMSRMNQVVEIDRESMYVVVEAGCTWESLDGMLSVDGLRTPFWGPFSGSIATIGGTLSQNAAFWGSATAGLASDSVLGLEVVIATGEVLRTGVWAARNAEPFLRYFGPDTTGLFLGDCGAMGIKSRVVLRVERRPEHFGFASFQFEHRSELSSSMTEIARRGLAVSQFGLDPTLQAQRIRRVPVREAAEAVVETVKRSKGAASAIASAIGVAVRGRRFLSEDAFSLHVTLEDRGPVGLAARMDQICEICESGTQVADSVPRLLYGKRWASATAAMGPEGQRWVSVHGLVPLQQADPCWESVNEVFAKGQDNMDLHGVEAGVMVSTVSTTAFLLEVVFTWPGERVPFITEHVSARRLEANEIFDPDPQADALVLGLRESVISELDSRGASHLQIGRSYPFLERLDAPAGDLLVAIKRVLDPEGIMNPGVLGLGRTTS